MVNSIDISTQIYNAQSNNLKNATSNITSVNNKDDEKLKKAASDFESVFVGQFLEMLDSTVEKSDFMHGGQAEDTFKSMLNQEIAKNISSNPRTSFGLAAQVYKQLKAKQG